VSGAILVGAEENEGGGLGVFRTNTDA
jgi:hypothetical protein